MCSSVTSSRMARSLALDDTDPQNLRERQQTVEIRGAGDRWISEGAVERRGGGVPDGEIHTRRQVGEVDEKIGAFGRCQHEPLSRQ